MLIPFDYGNPLLISERNLPHWEQNGVTYFVTFRLADSIPSSVAQKIKRDREEWLKKHDASYSKEDWLEYNKLFSERINNLLDAGFGSCFLRNREISDVVKKSLECFNSKRYNLGNWIIMPNHVHLLVTPFADFSLQSITQAWKSFTSRKINKILNRKGAVWQSESYDHIVRNGNQLLAIEKYILENPGKAKLTSGFQCSFE